MWLRALQADRLRNLRSVDLSLGAGLTVVFGRNGHGKTSLLEAVYLAATAHSFRTRRLDDLIARSGGPLKVGAAVAGLAGETLLGVAVETGSRRLSVDGVERELTAFLGHLDVVALPNESMRVLRDGPDTRRRFIDSGIAGLRPAYLSDLGEYRRTLAERNALLRRRDRAPSALDGELEAWDDRLAAAAARVHRQRREYVVALAAQLGPAERALFPDGEAIAIRHRPSPAGAAEHDLSAYETIYRDALAAGRRRDAALGFTGEGPHRDDVDVSLAGADLRKYGSAGQLRAAMITLCAGKLGLIKDRRGELPLFLMDDFDSDLDESKTKSLVDFLREGGFQALLATSKDGFVNGLGLSFPKIRMEGGAARAA